MRRVTFLLVCLAPCAALAATPPALINYQGVLRSAGDAPLTGAYDMVFRLMSAQDRGDEILVDQHTGAAGGAVTVSGGLFSVQLGSGAVSDGGGPGTYTSLADVFRDYGTVWLQISVGGETLSPNTRIVAAAYALNASNLNGSPSSNFLDVSSSTQWKTGKLVAGPDSPSTGDFGVEGSGMLAGGFFHTPGGSGNVYLGYGDIGIAGSGDAAGGSFLETSGSGLANLGVQNFGIRAFGVSAGGYFETLAGAHAATYVAAGGYGIDADGTTMGGRFRDFDNSGLAYLGYGDRGVEASGSEMGGHFARTGSTNYAELATSFGVGVHAVGANNPGIFGESTYAGALFEDSDGSGLALLGFGDGGVYGSGNSWGGSFEDVDNSGLAYVGYGDRGIWAKGTFAGGTFSNPDNVTFWADVSTPTYKIKGTGSMAFAQNDPEDPGRVIVYNAPEGDEVATYTRGSGRLEAGVARIPLEKTFALVTNPDLGLTAHLTPRGAAASLYVESLSTKELVVRGGAGSPADTAFDYLVYGLRIGFEREAVVQAKDREAPLPPGEAFETRLLAAPEARASTALERFKGMAATVRRVAPEEIDLSGAAALEASIAAAGRQGIGRVNPGADRPEVRVAGRGQAPSTLAGAPAQPPAVAGDARTAAAPSSSPEPAAGPAPAPSAEVPAVTILQVSEVVEAGDLLSLDPLHPGWLHRAGGAGDPAVVGVAAAASETVDGETTVAVADSRFALLRVDAGYGEIRAGDLLTSSATPGRAMRALDPQPGTVIGKALEPLASGLGTIRVLLMSR